MRKLARVLVVGATTALVVGGLALPASATTLDYKCSVFRYSPSDQERFTNCIYETTTHAFYGDVYVENNTSLSQGYEGTIIVQQCQAGPINCVTITAQHFSLWVYAGTNDVFTTSSKAGSYGHVYRTCTSGDSTSGWSWVFVCTAADAYTP